MEKHNIYGYKRLQCYVDNITFMLFECYSNMWIYIFYICLFMLLHPQSLSDFHGTLQETDFFNLKDHKPPRGREWDELCYLQLHKWLYDTSPTIGKGTSQESMNLFAVLA